MGNGLHAHRGRVTGVQRRRVQIRTHAENLRQGA
jgi:hypothetical protein